MFVIKQDMMKNPDIDEMDFEDNDEFFEDLSSLIEDFIDESDEMCRDLLSKYYKKAKELAQGHEIDPDDLYICFDALLDHLRDGGK